MTKETIVVGNWKSEKDTPLAAQWLKAFSERIAGANLDGKLIVVCPPFTLLAPMKEMTLDLALPIELGAQNVSPFGPGKHTGEVNAHQIREYASWVIIGHSERRENETDEQLFKKVEMAREAGLKIVYCVENAQMPIPEGVEVVAYEPPGAIGTGKPDTPENASLTAKEIKERNPSIKRVIYGGSVVPENVVDFISQNEIDGVLPGGASLDPEAFSMLVTAIPKS